MAKRLGAAGMNLLVIDTGGLGGVAAAGAACCLCLLACWEDARVLLCLVCKAVLWGLPGSRPMQCMPVSTGSLAAFPNFS